MFCCEGRLAPVTVGRPNVYDSPTWHVAFTSACDGQPWAPHQQYGATERPSLAHVGSPHVVALTGSEHDATRTVYLQRGAICQSPDQQARRAGSGDCGFDSRWIYEVMALRPVSV
jgi:hypothetical protein